MCVHARTHTHIFTLTHPHSHDKDRYTSDLYEHTHTHLTHVPCPPLRGDAQTAVDTLVDPTPGTVDAHTDAHEREYTLDLT